MKIKKIKIENYRLLKDFVIDLEDDLSLVIGKNNTGKTSLLSVLDKFLNLSEVNKFSFDDFNLDFKETLKGLIELGVTEDDYQSQGIRLKLFIEYDESDDLSNISRVMMNLDPKNNFVILGFEYVMVFDDFIKLRKDFDEYNKKEDRVEETKGLDFFLKQNYADYFKTFKKSMEYNLESGSEDEKKYIDLNKEKISLKDIISFDYISAKRDVTNKEADKTLSSQTSRIYKKTEASDEQEGAIEKFKDQLVNTDHVLSDIYSNLFEDVVKKVRKFGGVKENDSIIEIVSTLQHRELLDGNTTVMYNHNGHALPEHYNGLGYMNLISIVFEIEILLKKFKKSKDEKPSDINLLFIEEPEAHTHPQMQYIFIKNIKNLLKDGLIREDGKSIELQYIISTHSSHIVSESDFDDIKYLKKVEADNSVISKNLKSLEEEYELGKEGSYRFLTQYLTLNKTELFFADKAILIEGDTERILLPAMMKKADQVSSGNPLLSQNISIVEVGAYSQVFEKFIDFVGVKSLIITDIDSGKEVTEEGVTKTKACKVSDENAGKTTNSSLNFFFDSTDLSFYKTKELKNKVFSKRQSDKKWIPDENGYLLLVFQTEEENTGNETYHARSFEDSFFHLNKDFIIDKDNSFNSLTKKWVNKFRDGDADVYEFAEKAVGSKPSLAIEILLNSKNDGQGSQFSNWQTPHYIKEGLEWLRKD